MTNALAYYSWCGKQLIEQAFISLLLTLRKNKLEWCLPNQFLGFVNICKAAFYQSGAPYSNSTFPYPQILDFPQKTLQLQPLEPILPQR